MTCSHHPDDATLLRYAAGDLDEAFTVVVASHLALCAPCRRIVRDAEEIGGHLLGMADGAPVAGQAFDKLMSAIDADTGDAGGGSGNICPFARPARETDAIPAPLRRFVGDRLETIKWQQVVPGISRHVILEGGKGTSSLFMMKIAEGHAIPDHGHGGMEMTLVISGAYTDGLGRFGRGDVADLDEHVAHRPVADAGAPCICVAATQKPVRFKGLVERLLQPFVGI